MSDKPAFAPGLVTSGLVSGSAIPPSTLHQHTISACSITSSFTPAFSTIQVSTPSRHRQLSTPSQHAAMHHWSEAPPLHTAPLAARQMIHHPEGLPQARGTTSAHSTACSSTTLKGYLRSEAPPLHTSPLAAPRQLLAPPAAPSQPSSTTSANSASSNTTPALSASSSSTEAPPVTLFHRQQFNKRV